MILPVQTWDPHTPPPRHGWLAACGPEPALWLARLPATTAEVESLAADLAPDERGRAYAFQQAADRARALLGRALVRRLLGAELGVPPHQLRIARHPAGKPFLKPARPDGPRAPFFNLSHSGDWVLAAFHPSNEVGVDIEQVNDACDWTDVSARVFSGEAHAAWLRLPPARRPGEFFQNWTRHEAGLKVGGLGFATPAIPARQALTIANAAVPAGYAGACAWAAPV